MEFGSSALLWLMLGVTNAQSIAPARYVASARPAASLTLEVDSAFHSVRVLQQTNVAATIEPAEAADLRISNTFDIECLFRQNSGLLTVGAYADSKYHLIPIDIVSYKTYDPSYLKLKLDELYLTNKIDRPNSTVHRVYINFFFRDQPI